MKHIKKINLVILIACLAIAAAIAGCAGSQPTATQATSTDSPTQTSAPTQEAEQQGAAFTVWQGGFSFVAPLESELNLQGGAAYFNLADDPIIYSINGLWDTLTDLEATEMLDTMLSTLFSSTESSIDKSDPLPIEVGGAEGIVYDFTGEFVSAPVEGRAFVVKPSQNRYVFMVGMATTDEQTDLWQTTGSGIFDSVVKSIAIIPEDQLGSAFVCPISADEAYGFSAENPIKVGGNLTTGLMRELAYLDNLLGLNGEEVTYERLGSVQSPTSILDEYQLTVGTQEFTLYLDEYSYGVITAPQGLSCRGAFPIGEP
ncbi:MAG: hypothetical protein WA110_00670 [Anaerolineaceae bacterium]